MARRRPRLSDEAEAALRILRARVGALALHASRDGRETTAAGRAAFLSRFERQVDPRGDLDPNERARRADFAKRAYFTALALRSATARRARAAGRTSEPPRAGLPSDGDDRLAGPPTDQADGDPK